MAIATRKKVASVWSVNDDWAKSVIGHKIVSSRQNLVDADIASTASSVACFWEDSGLSYEDAELLAEYWGVSIGDAKAQVAAELTQRGNNGFYEDTLIMAYDRMLPGDLPFGQELREDDVAGASHTAYIEAFENNGYGFCDAMKLGTACDTDYSFAKLLAGQKIVDHGNFEAVNNAIQSTLSTRPCSWGESDLTYEDAEKLSAYWDVSVGDAKQKVSAHMSRIGYRAFVSSVSDVLEE